jgi:uridine kinase
VVTFRDKIRIKDHLRKVLNKQGPMIITMDGKDGSGKTKLSKYLSNELSLFHLELDDERYLIPEKGGYVDYIKYDRLKADIIRLLKDKAIIVDGICVLAVFKNMRMESDLKIYVKKLMWGYYWFDGGKLDYSVNVEDFLEEENKKQKKFNEFFAEKEGTIPQEVDIRKSVSSEIVRYHFNHRPDRNADIIYERTDETE